MQIPEEGLLLVIVQHELGVQGQVAGRVDRKLREEVALGDVDATEPVGPGDAADAIPRNLQIARTGRLLDIVERYDIDEIIVACDERRNNLPLDELLECKLRGVEINDILELIERETGQISVDLVYPSWMIYSSGFKPADNIRTQLDWLFNFSIATMLMFVTWPLMLGTAIAIWLEDGRRGAPLFYRQVRVGLHGQNFKILKFRSMRVDAQQRLAELLATDLAARAEWERDFKLAEFIEPAPTPLLKPTDTLYDVTHQFARHPSDFFLVNEQNDISRLTSSAKLTRES